MKSSFFEYHVAMSGIYTARANLQVISHNVANAAMPGFSRQVTLQKASRPVLSGNGKGMYGTGSEVYGVSQIRDIYLDRKYWSQKALLGEYSTKNNHLALIETLLNDLPETNAGKGSGIRSTFSDFFSVLQDLTTNTPDATYRTNVITAGETLAELIKSNAEALQKQQRDINQEVEGIVSRINSLGTQISSLNRQIYQYELDGSMANDLRDQRALLVDQLSEYANVQVEERDYSDENIPHDKRYIVMINGYDFVNHFSVQTLQCVPRDQPNNTITINGRAYDSDDKRNEMDVPGLYDIYFINSGGKFDIYSPTLKGTLKGLIDVRDGNNGVATEYAIPNDPTSGYETPVYKGIPFYMNKLNTLVRTFARAINEGLDSKGNAIPDVTGHIYGYDKYGPETGQASGRLFFTYIGGAGDYANFEKVQIGTDGSGNPIYGQKLDYSELNCFNFIVNPDLTKDPYLLATNSSAQIGQSNNDVIAGFLKINTYTSLFNEGKLMDFIVSTTDHLAIDRMQARKFEESYDEITMATDNQRMSISGVDINEEMMAMIKYQQVFQACAKLVNVINSIYDSMINRLGVF